MEWKHPSIVALKGYPFTGRSSLAFELALHLRLCQLLSLDDILDSITPPSYSSATESDQQLIGKAFDILCGLVEKQLSIGQSVIIDSLPLSRPHLDRLARLSESSNATKFIIIECQIERQYAWKMRFEEKHMEADAIAWYKPQDWDAITKLVKDKDKSLDEYIPGVSRLMLNVDVPVRGRHLIQAIQTLVFCQEDRHVDYEKWNGYNLSIMHQYEYKDHQDHAGCTNNCGHDHDHHRRGEKELINQRLISRSSHSCKDGHRITVFTGEGLVGYQADCGVCENPVIGPAYACNSCQMALHKSCAEMQLVEKKSFTPKEFPTFIRNSTSAVDNDEDSSAYFFPQNFPCFHCREDGREYSAECSGCIYESHLKCRLVPTVIEHEGHEHKLSFWAMKISSKGAYTCGACGKEAAYAAYACHGCERNYHVKCALLPYPIKDHKHGGHQHTVELVFKRKDTSFDDFPCSHCSENMSPEDWYYFCALCDQTYHLECAFLEDPDC